MALEGHSAGTEFSLQRNGILESAPSEPIHCERRQYSRWNQDAQLRFAAAERHPGNCRVSTVHVPPQDAWRRVSLSLPRSAFLLAPQRGLRIDPGSAPRRQTGGLNATIPTIPQKYRNLAPRGESNQHGDGTKTTRSPWTASIDNWTRLHEHRYR
jgi:hypothetical protein